ncbi:MAG: acyl-ACP thioesterase domain-containing protein [Bacteroidota bacterium]
MSKKTRQSFQVRSYEVDINSKIRLNALWNYMLETAWNNAAELGASVLDLHELGISWVLSRLKLTIHHYPNHQDEVYVESWPSGFAKFFVYRDFRIYNSNHELIAEATSTWVVFDLASRKLTSLPDQFKSLLSYEEEEALPRANGKMADLDDAELLKRFNARWSDVDNNRHVNNGAIVQWISETMTDGRLGSTLSELDIIFKKECRYGDEIYSKVQFKKNYSYHSLELKGGQLAAQAILKHI